MVAALQSPPEYRARPVGTRPAGRVPARVVPLQLVRDPVVPDPVVPDLVLRPASPRVTRSPRASVYWRRRLIAASLGLGIVLAAAHAGTALGGSTTSTPERRPQVTTVVVRPGDTLWTIAQRIAPDTDPRVVVDKIASERGTSEVRAGDSFQVAT